MMAINILNICSDIGNIGDDASHVGLQTIMKEVLPRHNITKLDIRDFYFSQPKSTRRYFDDDLAAEVNKYDLCIIGGGAYLDYPIPGSINGPTIDLTDGFLAKLKTKTLIASVSCRPKSADAKAQEKMSLYLQKLQENENIEILLRNDGSIKHLSKSGFPTEKISEILDHGFFLTSEDTNDSFATKGADYCCLNIVHDQLSFFGNNQHFINYSYYQYMADLISVIARNYFQKIVLIPHIYQDLIAITEILKKLPRKIINENIIIHPCSQGHHNAMVAFGTYNNSAVNIGTRFHTNVCSFTLGRPTIPIALTGRIQALCDDLNVRYDLDDILTNFSSVLTKSWDIENQEIVSLIQKKKENTLDVYKRKLVDYV
jgi:polysaccharide pyruvyl transferase WcaK-like protein